MIRGPGSPRISKFKRENGGQVPKQMRITVVVCFCVFRAIFPASTHGQTASPAAINATNFAMIGITHGQTLQINVVAYPPDPCFAQLGFQDSNGNPIGATSTVARQATQSASVSIEGLPIVLPTVIVSSAEIPPNQCVTSAEMIDNVLGLTSVLIPGSTGWSATPIFGLLGVTEFQTVRLNVVAYPLAPMNATTPNGLGQFVVVAIIAEPLPNCPFCPPPPPPFGIFSTGATVFAPAVNATNGNARVGPTNVRSFAVAMLNPLMLFGWCSP